MDKDKARPFLPVEDLVFLLSLVLSYFLVLILFLVIIHYLPLGWNLVSNFTSGIDLPIWFTIDFVSDLF